MKTIALVIGTRPEAVKLSPIALLLRGHADLRCQVCVTAQHRDMLDQVLDVFGITPDLDLNLMQPAQTLAALTARAIEGLDGFFSKYRPDLVLVQGDTTSVFCATLAAFYRQIPVGHVEAGLRTGNLQSPWPEEANRVLTTRLATLHFAPTENARQNLLNERVPESRIFVTGNTGIDALFNLLARDTAALPIDVAPGQPMVLITAHRRENFGAPFERVCAAIHALAERFPQTLFVYPVHPNPNVLHVVDRILRSAALPNVCLIAPLSYPHFVAMMNRATIILTDSGGVQEEAPSLGKPVLVLRDTTERPEAVDAGTVKIVGTDFDRILSQATTLLTDTRAYEAMSRAHNPYGDGQAARRIVRVCREFLLAGESRQ